MLSVFSMFLASCGNTITEATPDTDEPTEDAAAAEAQISAGVAWGSSDSIKMGLASPGGTLSMTTLQSSGSEAFFPTCFDNNRTCRRADSTVIAEVGNAPVLAQGFQLNFTYSNKSGSGNTTWSSVSVDSASVTTAELQFDSSSGVLSLSDATTQQLVSGATCSLSSSYGAVGYSSTASNPKLLVGARFVEEATKLESTSNGYSNGHLTAGRFWHSGILGVVGTSLRFKFVPDSDAATRDFGLENFTEGGSSGIVVSPKFMADSSISGYKNHVILGFCIAGKKVGSSGTRPLLYYSEAYVRTPKLQKLQ